MMARMLSQLPLPLLPAGAAEIAPGVGLLGGEDGGLVVVHGLATFAWDAGDCCASLKMPMKAALAVPMWGCSKPRSRGGCGALVGVVPVAVGVVPVMCRCIR